jgi:ubiquitin C-terminal hydrolase
MKGFNNIGNTCYLNSGLQMLIQNKDLSCLIMKYMNDSDILRNIGNLINDYYSGDPSPLNPIEIKNIVQEKQELFSGYGQQDSTEFIIYFLDIVEEEIKKITKTNEVEKIFGINFNVRIKCKLLSCLNISVKKEINNFLILDIDSNVNNLDDAYRKFKSSEKLYEENQYFCEECKDKRIASKRTTINEWPDYVCIWLRRFTQRGNRIIKNNQDINIPLSWRHNLKLYGAIIHFGNIDGGHYIYVGKQNDEWYIFNDSQVSKINSPDELSRLLCKSYTLCYTLLDI